MTVNFTAVDQNIARHNALVLETVKEYVPESRSCFVSQLDISC